MFTNEQVVYMSSITPKSFLGSYEGETQHMNRAPIKSGLVEGLRGIPHPVKRNSTPIVCHDTQVITELEMSLAGASLIGALNAVG